MIIYAHVANDFRSFGKVWPLYKPCSIIGADGKTQGARGANFSKPINLACRRIFGKSLSENRKKAWTEAEEKKYLIISRTTIIMHLLMKGALL